jgi:hypothetical protein
VLAGLVPATKWVKVTLAQMAANSTYLQELYSSPEPKIPYILIAGNTSLIATAGDDEERKSRLRACYELYCRKTRDFRELTPRKGRFGPPLREKPREIRDYSCASR